MGSVTLDDVTVGAGHLEGIGSQHSVTGIAQRFKSTSSAVIVPGAANSGGYELSDERQ
mgnify:CR=1 FL=1